MGQKVQAFRTRLAISAAKGEKMWFWTTSFGSTITFLRIESFRATEWSGLRRYEMSSDSKDFMLPSQVPYAWLHHAKCQLASTRQAAADASDVMQKCRQM